MSEAAVYQDVLAIISKHAKNQEALKKVDNATSILKDLQVNSARFVDIVLDFEDKFELSISDSDADKIVTIGDAVALVERLRQ
jgi:acyl carrier protein